MPFRPEIIRYLHDCYREDNARGVLWNLLGSSVDHLIFLKGNEELLDGFLHEVPLSSKRGRAAYQDAVTYQKEKQLLYTAFPIVGKLALANGKTRSICAPLLTFPAEIKIDGDYTALCIDLEGRRTNSGLLDALQSGESDVPLTDLIDACFDDWQIEEPEISAAARTLAAGISHCDASTMWQFPTLTAGRELRAAAAEATLDSGFQVFPSAAVCLVKRPTESRGVLTELQEIAETQNHSRPLQAIITGEIPPPAEPDTTPETIPAVLSLSQTEILRRARTEPLSLVIGPPGTGKSYTIAAIALDHLNRGESVVVGSKMNHAVDVIANKIEEQLGASGKVVRAGRRHYMKALKSYIDSLLNSPQNPPGELLLRGASLAEAFKQTDQSLRKLEEKIEDTSALHIRWGKTLAALSGGSQSIFKKIAGYFISRKNQHLEPLWSRVTRLHELLRQRSFLASDLIQNQQDRRIEQGIATHRKAIKTLRTALGARTGTRQEQLFDSIDLDVLLSILPVWLTNLSDAHRVLPNRQELFDVAIIDEASQCDIASCLPLLQRAKRAVIVGDPRQLRHLSFLANDRQREFADNHSLTDSERNLFNYRNRSILDLASARIDTQECIHFLNEHFRSEPAIIRFSNQQFYADKLNVMTEKPGRESRTSIHNHRISGERSKDGINRAEAEAILCAIESRLAEGLAGLQNLPSIGVLSPFRAQVDHLAARINERFGNEIFARHQILIGTAHTFQGEERDLMFLSFAIDADSPAASRRFLERPDLFNVAITRARQHQAVFSSIDPTTLPAESLLRKYLTFIETANDPILPEHNQQLALLDRFASEVQHELESRGYQVWLGCPVAGLNIDLLAARDGQSLAIDLIGCPGPTAHVFPLERYKMFQRAGLALWPLPYTNWIYDREGCLRAIETRHPENLTPVTRG